MTTTAITGILQFYGWLYPPWGLRQPDERAVDVFPHVDRVLQSLNGKKLEQLANPHAYELRCSEDGMVLEYEPGALCRLTGKNAGTNIFAFLPFVLIQINGRRVQFEARDNGFKFEADPGESVHELTDKMYPGVYRIPCDVQESICRIGTREQCVFASRRGTATNFEVVCDKFNDINARTLLNDSALGRRAFMRIGGCKVGKLS